MAHNPNDSTADDNYLVRLEDFEPHVGRETIDRILKKAEPLKGKRVAHVNSTHYGGGVAELLDPLTLLMNEVGLRTEWRVIQGTPDFFSVTKKMHNALQGADINLSERKKKIYRDIVRKNAIRSVLDHDFVVVHDPQPMGLIDTSSKHGPWTWRCHVDLSNPNAELFDYLKPSIEKYDAVIVTVRDYKQDLVTPQLFFLPCINPFCTKNRDFSEKEIDERLRHHDIPTDKPLVAQVSRFDRHKDPRGVIEAFRLARKKVDARLVLLGHVATDDPEGEEIYKSLLDCRTDDIRIMSRQDSALVNALQRKSAVVLQKSIREGFGLTVTEAMWKGAAVIGGNVGGIRYQIEDGENGYLVDDVEQAAERIVTLVKNPDHAQEMGRKARESVKRRFLMTRLLEQYLDLFNSFKTNYTLEDGQVNDMERKSLDGGDNER